MSPSFATSKRHAHVDVIIEQISNLVPHELVMAAINKRVDVGV